MSSLKRTTKVVTTTKPAARSAASAKSVKTTTILATPGRRRRNRARKQKTNSYVNMLEKPFSVAPSPLGFGTAVPTSIYPSFRKVTMAVSAVDTCFAVVVRPQNTGMVSVYHTTNASTLLSAATAEGYDASNKAFIDSVVVGSRVISGGVRVNVRMDGESRRGLLGGCFLPSDSYTNLMAKNFSGLEALEVMDWSVPGSGSGEMSMEVQYRPFDNDSFTFRNFQVSGHPAGNYQPLLLIVGVGWAQATFSVDVEALFNYESVSGLLASGADDLSTRGGPKSSDEAILNAKITKPAAFTLDTLTDYASAGTAFMKNLGMAHAAMRSLFGGTIGGGHFLGTATEQKSDDDSGGGLIPPPEPPSPAPDPSSSSVRYYGSGPPSGLSTGFTTPSGRRV